MKNDTAIFKSKYECVFLKHVEAKDLKEFVKDVVEQVNKEELEKGEYFSNDIIKYLSTRIDFDKYSKKNVFFTSRETIAYAVISSEKILWINCDCGSVGKFRKVK